MCDKTVASYLLASKFIPNSFVTKKIIEDLDRAVFSHHCRVFGNLESDLLFICFLHFLAKI